MSILKSANALLASMGLSLHRESATHFDRASLPTPAAFWAKHGIDLTKKTGWTSTKCVFHEDSHASLSVNSESGGFFCFACGAKGGDVLAAHRLLTGEDFVTAAKTLGAWSKK